MVAIISQTRDENPEAKGRRGIRVNAGRRAFFSAGASALALSGCLGHWPEPVLQKISTPRAEASRFVDTHVHFYDPAREGDVPWPSEKDELLYRTVLPRDFLQMAKPHGVHEAIVVETSPLVEDNQWLLDLATDNPSILGVVGNLPVGDLEFRGNLELFSKNPLFRGIRIRAKELKNLPAAYAEDLRHLADQGLCLDVLGSPAMLPDIVELAETVPDLHIVINHFPFDSPTNASVRDASERALEDLATWPNVFAKVSDVVRKVAQKSQNAETYRARLNHLWKTFGPNRLMYGSNWPVSERVAPYSTVIGILKEYHADKPAEQAEKFFWRNSRVAYDWKERS